MNYLPRLYVIATDQGYMIIHVVSTKFEMFITFSSLYCVISNHPMTVSIIVMGFNIDGPFPLWSIL